jgi:hypothetical protein
VSFVVRYLAEHYDELGLDRFGIARRPMCLVLTPRFRHSRHVIVLVLREGTAEPSLVAKLPRLAGDGAALAREATILHAAGAALAGADAGTAPELVAFDDRPGSVLLLESALVGRPVSPRLVRRDRAGAVADVAGWLERLALATAQPARGDGWYARLVERPLHSLYDRAGRRSEVQELAGGTLAAAESLRAARLPLVLEHGDLGHPNLLRLRDGRVGVLDWERGDATGLPGGDLLFFLAYAGMATRSGRLRADPLGGVRDALLGPRAWARPVLERHLNRLGVAAELVLPLMAVQCARVVAAVAGSDLSSRSRGRDAAARHLALWRGLVSHGAVRLSPVPTPTAGAA